jgi:prophage tail gpP-like protein
MSLSLFFNGLNYNGFTEAEVKRDIETGASSFSFTSTSSGNNVLPMREGDKVQVFADDEFKILTGFIDEYDLSYTHKSHSTTVKGRSLTADIIDSTISSPKTFIDVGFLQLCKDNVEEFGIEVISEIPEPSLRNFEDIDDAKTGQKIFEFLELFARRRQVLLTDNENGNLIITRASSKLNPNSLRNIIGASDNNIIAGGRRVNLGQLYNTYIAQSQFNPLNVNDLGVDILPDFLSGELGQAIDTDIRAPRRYEFFTEETTDTFTLLDRARWEMSIRRARNFEYKCTVQGHSQNGLGWNPNILHQIDDDFARIYGQFLCKSLTYRYSVDTGSLTDLVFTNKNAYTLQSEKDKILIDFEEVG